MGRVYKPGIGSSFELFENWMWMALRGAPSVSSVSSCQILFSSGFFEQEQGRVLGRAWGRSDARVQAHVIRADGSESPSLPVANQKSGIKNQ